MIEKPSYEEFQERLAALEKKNADLEAASRKFRQLEENLNDVLYSLSSDATITYISPNVERIAGYAAEELIGQNYSAFVGPEDMVNLGKSFRRILAGEELITEHQFVTRNRGPVWAMTKARPVYEGPEVVGIQGTLLDITERRQQEQALKESEQRYRLLVDASNDIVWTFDLSSMTYTFCSKSIERHLGYSPEEVKGFRVGDIHPAETKKWVLAAFGKVVQGDTDSDRVIIEARHRHKKGGLVWMEISAVLHRDSLGQPVSFTGVTRDITERKQAEEALENEHAFLSGVLDTIGEAIVICDAQGRLVRFNEAARRLHGLPEQPIAPEQWARYYDLYQPDGTTPLPTEEIPLFRAFQGERVIDSEMVVVPRQGRPYYLVCNGQAMVDEAGRTIGAVVAMHDITERKRTEAALRESEEKYRNLFENAPVGVFRTHSSGNVLLANSTIARILGFKSAQETVAHYDDLAQQLFVNPERRGQLLQILQEQGFVENFEYEARAKDGRILWLSINARKVSVEADGSFVLEGFLTDITARKQAEEEKARLEEQFHQSQKMESIGRLAGGVAHDLNNLLSPILGYGEMLLEDAAANDPRRESMEEIVSAGKRAQALIRQLLAFSRKQSLQFQPFNINVMVKDFKKLLRRTLREDIKIQMRLARSLPQVRGDIGQLGQVVMNLAVNAQDAMPHGGKLSIETASLELDADYARQRRGVAPGCYVMMAISDTGSGMDGDTREHLFEPFFTTKEKGKGTGLGLSTAYGIVKQHGGNIWVYSEPGLGTSFKVYLPVSEASPEEAIQPQHRQPAVQGSETILLVEDDRQVRNLAEIVLKRHGYAVLIGENGQEALSIMDGHEGEVQLLLTDVIMPDINGKELFEQVSRTYPDIRVLYMSGYTDDVIAHHGVIDPAVNFIEKPFTVKGLALKVREVLDQ